MQRGSEAFSGSQGKLGVEWGWVGLNKAWASTVVTGSLGLLSHSGEMTQLYPLDPQAS